MAHPEITHVAEAIHNPADARHFMRLKPVSRRVRLSLDGEILADTRSALRLIEVGRDVYDPVLYAPRADVSPRLRPAEGASHCPLKGDARYFDLLGVDGQVKAAKIAWSYETPLPFAAALAGRLAFYADRLTVEEAPL